MHQLEIKFFFPLTEQIPLDLDYSVCERKLTTLPITNVMNGQTLSLIDSNVNWTTTFVVNDNVVIKTREIGFLGRLLYKLMGLKWEKNE